MTAIFLVVNIYGEYWESRLLDKGHKELSKAHERECVCKREGEEEGDREGERKSQMEKERNQLDPVKLMLTILAQVLDTSVLIFALIHTSSIKRVTRWLLNPWSSNLADN